jgi:hypothetical protein
VRRAREHSRGSRRLPDLAALVAVLVLTGPLWWSAGHGLARDMVFTPRYALDADAIGMGTGLPRAVPLDALLALLTSVVDGAVVFRVAVAGVLLLASCGAHRVVADLPLAARLLAAVAAVWNPFVIERIALGQWALLAAYAALWWLLPALRAAVDGSPGALHKVLGWAWLGSITPTGGVLVLLVAACCTFLARRPVLRPGGPRRAAGVVAVVAVGQLPWVLPGVLAGVAATSDPEAVAAFSSRAERAGGELATLVGTGGVWSRFVVPDSLGTGFGHVLTLVVVVLLVANLPMTWRREPGLVVAAGIGFLLAALPHLPGGEELLRWAVVQVPGAGILRDSQKWLLPYVVLVVVSAARSLAATWDWLQRRDRDLAQLLAGVLVLLPVILVPDATVRTWEALRPVHLPADLGGAVARLDDADEDTGAAVTLPWASYRRFEWGNPVSAADPFPRWSRHDVVASDELETTRGTLSGEDRRAREVAELLEDGDPGGERERLAALGVGWVLVYRDQPGASALDLDGLEPVERGTQVSLYRVPGPVAAYDEDHSVASVVTVAAVDAAWLLAGLVAGLLALLESVSRGRGKRRRVRTGEAA